jgi:hypothetical protein
VIGAQTADRGVSIAVSHVLTLAITTVLISMLLIGASSVLDAETDRSAERSLETIGERLAGEIDDADRLLADGTRESMEITVDHQRTVPNSAYTVEVRQDCDSPLLADDAGCLRLSADDLDIAVFVPLADGVEVEERTVRGGTIELVGREGSDELREERRTPGGKLMNGDRTRALRRDDRAVSEVLSFVLVFGIILASVAVLSMTGFQAMQDSQRGEQLRNGERAMEALADNVNDVLRYDGIDQRRSELTLRDGEVVTGDDGTELTVEFDIDGGEAFEETYDLGTLAYKHDADRIAYEGGGVIRADDTGSVVIAEPSLTCRRETALVSLVSVDAADRSVQSADGVGLTMRVEDRTTAVYDVDGPVSITAEETPYERAWGAVEDDWADCRPDRVRLAVVTVDVSVA